MKEYFVGTYRGHQFEFTRVLSSSFDPWYFISVNLNDVNIKYRMHADKGGTWKITVGRLPWLLYSLEGEFNDRILLNEKPQEANRR